MMTTQTAHFKPLSLREWLHGPDLSYYWGDTLPKYTRPNWHAVARGMTVMMMSSEYEQARNFG